MYYIIPFIGNVQKKQIHRDRKWITDCQWLGGAGYGVTAPGFPLRVMKMF